MVSLEPKTLVGACHCGKVQLSITIPDENLPLKVNLCHCNSCRYTHGTLCSNQATLPTGVEPELVPPSTIDRLTCYAPSSFDAERYFCSSCGCQIGDKFEDGTWTISSGIFNAKDQESFAIRSQYFANSTMDGGLSTFVSNIEHVEVGSYDDNEPVTHSGEDALVHPTEGDKLLAECHCGGVSFKISRPSESFLNGPQRAKWVSQIDETKWLACLDLCHDCRLVTGANVIGWMFAPTDHLSPAPTSNLLIGSSKSYKSSDGVVRTFCGTCGATVFYWCDGRPNIVDIATGILRAPEGVRAENWLVWRTGRIAHLQNGVDYNPAFADKLKQGLEQWGESKYGDNVHFVIVD